MFFQALVEVGPQEIQQDIPVGDVLTVLEEGPADGPGQSFCALPGFLGSHPGLSLGQRVYHQIFGEGVVLNFEGRGSSARVEVNFDDEGSKWLVLQYANLQLI